MLGVSPNVADTTCSWQNRELDMQTPTHGGLDCELCAGRISRQSVASVNANPSGLDGNVQTCLLPVTVRMPVQSPHYPGQ